MGGACNLAFLPLVLLVGGDWGEPTMSIPRGGRMSLDSTNRTLPLADPQVYQYTLCPIQKRARKRLPGRPKLTGGSRSLHSCFFSPLRWPEMVHSKERAPLPRIGGCLGFGGQRTG